jgi:hypothetical protein
MPLEDSMSRPSRVSIALVVAVALAISANVKHAKAVTKDSLIDVLVWGSFLTIDTSRYPPQLRKEIDALRSRSDRYGSRRQAPRAGDPVLKLVYDKQVNYEHLLVQSATSPAADALAVAYVSDLEPCYEWEGYPECPEREAEFAHEYRARHRDGPFHEFLPLLEAHRWLCTAEGYDYDRAPADAARARHAYRRALAVAERSSSALIRTAAAELAARRSCL